MNKGTEELAFLYKTFLSAPFFSILVLASTAYVLLRLCKLAFVQNKSSIYFAFTIMVGSIAGLIMNVYFSFALGLIIFGTITFVMSAYGRLYKKDRLHWHEYK